MNDELVSWNCSPVLHFLAKRMMQYKKARPVRAFFVQSSYQLLAGGVK